MRAFSLVLPAGSADDTMNSGNEVKRLVASAPHF